MNNMEDLFYAGLMNVESSCYINAILQILYFRSPFCALVYGMNIQEENKRNGWDFELKKLFCLMQSHSPGINASHLIKCFGWPSNVHQDAHEALRKLVGIMESKFEGTTDEKIKMIFIKQWNHI